MLSVEEIKRFIDEDMTSSRRQQAKEGLRYYEAKHDIKDYKIYYVNDDGELVEDDSRSNIKISHPFFTELIDQCSQYMLSSKERYVVTEDTVLQAELDKYFDDDFKMELNDLITYAKIEGDSYLFRYIDEDFKTRFKFADGLSVTEASSIYTSDGKDYVIYKHLLRIEKNTKVYGIQVWSDVDVTYYTMKDEIIKLDKSQKMNPKPHVIYSEDNETLYDTFGDVPFLRLDNNKNRISDLHVIKDLIDDYDLMSCGLSNNLQDVAEGIYVVKGWNGNSLDELTQNIKAKKQVAVGEGGDVDIKTINVPYQAREAKMRADETNIYKFGMGVNTSLVGDGNVTNVVIKSRYLLLDMKCNKMESQLKRMMKKVIKIVVDEINKNNETNYDYRDVWCDFKRETITNALDNAQIEQTNANTKGAEVNTILNIQTLIGEENALKKICEILDMNYEELEIDMQSAEDELLDAESILDEVEPVDEEDIEEDE